MISSHIDPNSLATRFRRKRMRYLDAAIERTGKPLVSIVDLGGTGSFWKMNLCHLVHANRIQRIDVYNVDVHSEGIEHVGNFHAQNRFAREIRRIARYHVVQTPNRYFPLDEIHREWLGGLVKSFVVVGASGT